MLLGLTIPVFYAMLQLITYFLIGFGLRKRDSFSSQYFKITSRFVVRIALPIYYFVRLSETDIGEIGSALFFPIASFVLTALAFFISMGVMRAFRFSPQHQRAGIAMGAFGNTSFLPLFLIEIFPLSVPIIETTFGITTPLLYLGAFTIVQSPMLWAVGNYLVAGKMGKPRVSDFISPPMFGIIAGLLVAALQVDHILQDPMYPFYHLLSSLENVGLVIFPLMIICLGAAIADLDRNTEAPKRTLYRLSFAVASVRLLIFPALFILLYFTVLRPLEFSPAHIWVIFLQMHIPTGTSLSIMALQAGKNQEETSFVILVNYIIYLFILPLYIIILFSLPGVLT